MLVTTSGRFPIVSRGEHPLRTAVDVWRSKGDTTPSAAAGESLAAVQRDAAEELIRAQLDAGVDVLGDGHVPVYDEWFESSAALEGVEVEGPIRYLDTNTYYHRWRFSQAPRRRGPSPVVAAYAVAARLTQKPVKACLFGPYTMWAYSLKEGAGASAAAFDALTEIWAEDVAELEQLGARYVQLDESVLLRPKHRPDIDLAARAIERIAAAAPRVKLIVHFACGVVGDLLGRLLRIEGLAGVGLDFTDAYRAPNLAALKTWKGDKLIQAGIADSRHIRVETEAELLETLGAVTRCVSADKCLASPSTALLYLPRHVAFEKLAALARAAHAFQPAVGAL